MRSPARVVPTLTRAAVAADLYRENQDLRRQLAELMSRARQNEQVLKRFQQLELRLIGIVGFRELIDAILQDYRQAFELDCVSLVLIDAEFERRRLLAEADVGPNAIPGLLFHDGEQALTQLFGPALRPQLTRFDPARHGGMFPAPLAQPASVALLPLLRWGRPIGSLNLGSRREDRFVPGMATNFIERLAAVAAICIENVTNTERLKHLGLTDALTGVHNRRYLDERLREEMDRSLRKGQPLSCLMLDIDRFKIVNDNYGHLTGDQVLREVAARIKSQLRLSDAMARYGGEEFAVLLVQTDGPTAVAVAERIRAAIAGRKVEIGERGNIVVTLSIGVATRTRRLRAADIDSRAKELIGRADRALYEAKTSGRDRVCVAPDEDG